MFQQSHIRMTICAQTPDMVGARIDILQEDASHTVLYYICSRKQKLLFYVSKEYVDLNWANSGAKVLICVSLLIIKQTFKAVLVGFIHTAKDGFLHAMNL